MDDVFFGTTDGKEIGKLGFLSDEDIAVNEEEYRNLLTEKTYEFAGEIDTNALLREILPQGMYNGYVLKRDGYLSPENGRFTPMKNFMSDFMDKLIEEQHKCLQDDRIRGRYSLTNKVELKPCPFCGGKAYLERLFLATSDGMDEINGCEVGCRSCGVYLRDLWEYDNIVERWNMRNGEKD